MSNKRENYFDKEIREKGVDFLKNKPVDQLQRDVIYVFRQLAAGHIDVPKYEKYWTDRQFLQSCLITANIKRNEYRVEVDALNYYLNQLNRARSGMIQSNEVPTPVVEDSFIINILNDRTNRLQCYDTIYEAFSILQNTGSINSLVIIPSRLRDRKNFV